LEKVVTSPSYDPTGRPAEPGVEQPDTRLGEPGQPGTFAEPELEYAPIEGARDYGQPLESGMGSSSTVETAKSEAANVKDTAADAAAGVKDVAKNEASNVADEAKYQARSLVDQTRSELRGQASNQQSALAEKLHGWASELGSMASKADGFAR
jgi:vacuolar-type H+-ATPase subunit H